MWFSGGHRLKSPWIASLYPCRLWHLVETKTLMMNDDDEITYIKNSSPHLRPLQPSSWFAEVRNSRYPNQTWTFNEPIESLALMHSTLPFVSWKSHVWVECSHQTSNFLRSHANFKLSRRLPNDAEG